MKRKILVIVVSVVLISLGALTAYKIFDGRILSSISLSRQGKIETDYFQLNLPSGWETQEPAPTGFALRAFYDKGESLDPAARKIDYKTSVYIAHKMLEGKTMLEYIEFLKDEVQQMKNDLTFHSENETSFNNNKAYLIDIESKEMGIEFKSILGVIQAKSGEVWVMSFNTPKLDWATTAPQFYSILNSFEIK